MMELGVDGTFKRRLKPDATPNVPLASPDPEKKNGETPVVQYLHIPFTSCFGLMADSAVVDSALVDAALRKSGLI